ncbi:MAG: efflux RND transporter periplasmic adaptor subunit [Chloroflexota bacterium]
MKKFLKKIWIPVVIVAILAGAYFVTRGNGDGETLYQTVKVERGSLIATVGATGTVRARQSVTLVWQTSGSVDKVNASIGDHVSAGTVLASLSPTSVSQNIILAQADLVAAQEALNDLLESDTARVQAQIALREAQEAYDKALEYRESLDDVLVVNIRGHKRYIEADEETIAKADERLALAAARLEDAQRAYDRVKDGPNPNDIAAAQARVDAAQATLNLARIIAPFSGTITDARPLVGDQVTNGAAAFRIDDLSSLLVDVEISEVDINSVSVGQPVTLTFDAILGKEYHGEVTQVSQAGVAAQGVVNFTVTVKITDADEKVKPGMTAAVTITVQELKDQVLIPNRAVRLVDGKRVVYVLRNGAPEQVEIRLGSSSDTMSVLAGGEVNVGDEIILNPPVEFQPGGPGRGPFGG